MVYAGAAKAAADRGDCTAELFCDLRLRFTGKIQLNDLLLRYFELRGFRDSGLNLATDPLPLISLSAIFAARGAAIAAAVRDLRQRNFEQPLR